MAGIRIIGGEAQGRKLRLVPGSETRPVSDRVKEALFNILRADVQGCRFLDLFAGTGSVGIEALSRGAAHCVFLDTNRQAIRTIHANLELTGFEERAAVHRQDAFGYLSRSADQGFDLVYVAPPQHAGLWNKAVQQMDADPRVLNPDAWVIVQIHPNEYLDLSLERLEAFDRRRYGSTELVFYEFVGS
ncbi:MAG TPA: 16S rRNA (guanine(966)-N(2))-methyltransferase RsmD [Anaerolineae bacterium]|nr:16S rRNA (guanine(966)-N(2))-methyltransferase RsmD [Anaerolineae bacterium]